MRERLGKVVNTNLGIFLICLFCSIFTLVDFIIIDKALDKYVSNANSVDNSGIIDDSNIVDDGNAVDVTKKENSEYLLHVYNSRYNKNVDSIFKFDQYKYHIVVNKDLNSISVGDKEVFKSDEKIYYVYLMQDILVVQVTNSDMSDKLLFIDSNGNIIKEIDNIAHNAILVSKTDVKYFIEKCDLKENEIYASCKADTYVITYNGSFSEPILNNEANYGAADIIDCDMEICTLYNSDNLKLEYFSSRNEQEFNPSLVVNGNKVDLRSYRLTEVQFTNDHYLYVMLETGTGAGLLSSFFISDLNGNVITNITEETLGSDFYDYHVSFNDNKIIYYADRFNSTVQTVCEARTGNGTSNINDTDLVFAMDEYQYVGNGNVSKIDHVEKTFAEYVKDVTGYDNCDSALANIDSWKNNDSIFGIYVNK